MKKISLLYILIINFILAKDWIEYNEGLISSNSVVIMLDDNFAPKLGFEIPAKLSDLSMIENILSKYGEVDFTPVFSNHTNFNQKHYDFNLHQYYKIEFNHQVDIFRLINDLKQIKIIENVEFDYIKTVNLTPNDEYYSNQWAHENNGQAVSSNGNNVGTLDCDTDTNQAWDITTGDDDIIIAILDTGVSEHVEFNGRLLEGYDFINNDTDAYDDNGHGTACAGIAAAKGNNLEGISGVCWDCLILPVKVLSFDGYGQDTEIADGVQWSADNGADVISMSLGGGGYVSYFDNAISYAHSIGTVVLAASGNDNAGTVSYPSGYDDCISVGALSPCNERKSTNSCDGENYWGSNYGNGLNFLAPGVRIHTTTNSGGYTSTFNGTSSACPHAAGIAGLIFSADQTLSSDAVKFIMEESADDLGAEGYDIQTGHGRINAFNALALIVSGPVIELSESELQLNMNTNQIATDNITIYNTGEMDLQYSIDAYGYQVGNSDINQNYSWVDISDNYEMITFEHNDYASNDIVYFDFEFPFYGNLYSSLIVNPNGWIGFDNDNTEWYNTALPNVDAPLNAIMPFWDDLNPNNLGNTSDMSGDVKYQSNNNSVIIWYDNVRHWVGSGEFDGIYDFQVVLWPDGNIDFNYRYMNGDVNSATIGIQDASGTNAKLISIDSDFVHDEFTLNIKPKPSLLDVAPLVGDIPYGSSSELILDFNTNDLSGDYNYNLEITSNDFNNPIITLPITLSVSNLPCDGISNGDLNYDGIFNVLDIISVVNVILYGSDDECDIILSDLNNDSDINILDIVSIINLILG